MAETSNKVVVITGAANGLGKALAIKFYSRGYHLALIDIDGPGLQNLQSYLQIDGQKVTIHIADIAHEQEVSTAKTSILENHGHVDVLINNASISNSQYFENVAIEDYRRLMEVNFWGKVYCSKYFLDALQEQPDGRLVNIISTFALMGFPGKTTYASSKSAVMGFTNALRTELAHTPLKVCLVIPPALDTGLIQNGQHIDPHKKQREMDFVKRNAMDLDIVATKVVSGILAGKHRIVIGIKTFWLDFLFRLLPTGMHKLIVKSKNRLDFV